MNSIFARVALLTALASNAVIAAPTARDTETAPFFLQVRSDDASINGKKLGTCHIGAGLESICLEPNDVQIFTLNSTSTPPPSNFPPGVSVTGNLVFTPGQYSQAMGLYQNLDSNLGSAIFGLGEVREVAFSKKEETLGYFIYGNDAVDPPVSTDGNFLEKWFLCKYNFEGYVYETLSWQYGTGKPTQPSCKAIKVDVKYQ